MSINLRSLGGGGGGVFMLGFLSRAWGTGTSVVDRVGMGVRAGVRKRCVFATERGSATESGLAMCNRSGLNTNAGVGGSLNPQGLTPRSAPHQAWGSTLRRSSRSYSPPWLPRVPGSSTAHIHSTSMCGPPSSGSTSRRVLAWGVHCRM